MPRSSTFRTALVLACVSLAMSACAGPLTPLDIASKEVPIDVLLGKRVQAVGEAPVPPLVIPRAAFEAGGVFSDEPAPVEGPKPTVAPPTQEAPSDCPEADPLQPPRLVARNQIDKPPVPATYVYRTEGKIAAAGGKLSILAPTSTITVGDVVTESTGWTFDVTMANAGLPPSTTTYRVLAAGVDSRPPTVVVTPPRPPDSVPRPNEAGPGLYLAGTEGFHPSFPGLAMIRFPLEEKDAFDASASDGPTTITQRSTVEHKAVFDACGTPIDVWLVTISGRSVTAGPGGPETVDFVQIIDVGTQYGGLFVSHRTDARSDTASKTVQLLASTEPLEPK
ncbi:MAG: hypothetical protein QOI20_3141 [Acidimicrobiaceae bacterium]|jgi:hypothetical protein|nr:hypothetical protein [Acidimicrobiaceae bacterium]